jgi:SAM-dependent methyltransferase
MALSVAANAAVFDAVAKSYEQALQAGLQLSGEGPEYFARRRIRWTKRLLRSEWISQVLDFGCGVGLAVPGLAEAFEADSVWGFDPSSAAIERAMRDYGDRNFRFTSDAAALPTSEFDLAYTNGVFHHIAPIDRPAALAVAARSLRLGGWLALWENNPWNPGTRMIMRRIPFDRDAVTLSPPETRRMLRAAGFRVVRTDAWFLFPRVLGWLRPLEALVHRLPLGGQYLVLAQKTSASPLS